MIPKLMTLNKLCRESVRKFQAAIRLTSASLWKARLVLCAKEFGMKLTGLAAKPRSTHSGMPPLRKLRLKSNTPEAVCVCLCGTTVAESMRTCCKRVVRATGALPECEGGRREYGQTCRFLAGREREPRWNFPSQEMWLSKHLPVAAGRNGSAVCSTENTWSGRPIINPQFDRPTRTSLGPQAQKNQGQS